LALILLAGVFFFRQPIATSVVNKALAMAGMKEVQVSGMDFEPDALRVATLHAQLPGGETRLWLQGLSLGWKRSSLETKKLDQITIERLQITLARQQSTKASPLSAEKIFQQIKKTIPMLPFHRLEINHLSINGPARGPLDDLDWYLSIQQRPTRLRGILLLREEQLRLSFQIPGAERAVQQRNKKKGTMRAATQDMPWQIELGSAKKNNNSPFLSLQAQVDNKGLRAALQADLAQTAALASLFHYPWPKSSGILSATFRVPFRRQGNISCSLSLKQPALGTLRAESLALRLKGEFRADKEGTLLVMAKDSGLNISGLKDKNFSIAQLHCPLNGLLKRKGKLLRWRLDEKARITASELKVPGLSIASLATTPAITASIGANNTLVTISNKMRFQLKALRYQEGKCANITLRPEKKNKSRAISLKKGMTRLQIPANWQLISATVQHPALTLEPTTTHFSLQPLPKRNNLSENKDTSGLKLALSWDKMALATPKIHLRFGKIQSNIRINRTAIRGTATLPIETVPGTIGLDFRHQLENGKSRINFHTTQALAFSELNPLSAFFSDFPETVQLSGGSLQLQGSLQRQATKPLRLDLKADFSEGSATIQGSTLSGISFHQDLRLLPQISSKSSGTIKIKRMENGITLNDFQLNNSLRPSEHGPLPALLLQDISASLLGGTVSDRKVLYDPQNGALKTIVELRDLDLAQLLALHKVEGLKVKGRIKGQLPIVFDSSGLRVEHGVLSNSGTGGTIRYTLPQENGLHDSPLTEYALKALEEFHYSLLSSTAEYQPDGNLSLNIHLEGRSPRLDTTRPVHLNINTEENVLSLLQSLRYSQSLTGSIDKDLEHHFNRQTP